MKIAVKVAVVEAGMVYGMKQEIWGFMVVFVLYGKIWQLDKG